MTLPRSALLLLVAAACSKTAPPEKTPPTDAKVWTAQKSPPGMPTIGEKCEGYSQTKYCIDDATLLECVNGRFTKQNCRDCTQIQHAASEAVETIQVDCYPTGLGADGAACNVPSRDCDGGALVVCDGKKFHHYPCGGPKGCAIDHGVKCDTSSSRPGDVCEDRGETYGACSTGSTPQTLMRCVDGHWKTDEWCNGPKGCGVDGEAISCDTSQADVGQECARGLACSRDGKSSLICWDGHYKIGQYCLGPDAQCGPVVRHGVSTLGCNNERIGEVGKPCLVRSCTPDGKSLLRCNDSWVYELDAKCKKGCDSNAETAQCK